MLTSNNFSPHRSPPPGVTSDAQSSSEHSLPNTASSTDQSGFDQAPLPFSEFNSANGRRLSSMSGHHNMNNPYEDDDEYESALGGRHERYPFAHEETGMETERELEEEDRNHHPQTDGEGNEMDDDYDSLADASDTDVALRALSLLGMDPEGRVLPSSPEDDSLLNSLWARAGLCDLRPGLCPSTSRPIDPDSPRVPAWFRKLQEEVLVKPPENPEDEELLVNAIRQNLLAIVNNLASDQWRHPMPPAFLPSSTSLSTRTTAQGPDNTEEAYLQTDFNPRSHTSLMPSDSIETSVHPPRQLWLGEDEDDGANSDVSLIDLLSATPARSDSQRSNHSARWSASGARRANTRHGQGSALARQVSRLGMTE